MTSTPPSRPRRSGAPRHAIPRRRPPTRAMYLRRRFILALSLVTVLMFGYYGVTLGFALSDPSNGVSTQARFAEWGRQHGLGFVVTFFENVQYNINKPKVGGAPPTGSFGSGPVLNHIPASGHLPAPKNIVPPATSFMAGEGVWHALGRRTSTGIPTMYDAFVRPDSQHTSFIAGLVWMDPTVLRAQLYSGNQIPGGGPFKDSAPISASASRTLAAVFNAGFRMPDAGGGYYTDHRVVFPLRAGAASAVVLNNGVLEVGTWGRDFTMNSSIASVRQNLKLIVDKSHAVPGLSANDNGAWGKVVGNSDYIWRSGMGETKNGAIVYVAGPSLSIVSLADLMVRAGVVRGMEMDINTDWVQFSSFASPNGQVVAGAQGTKLLSGMLGLPARYFASWWVRDFFTMSVRK